MHVAYSDRITRTCHARCQLNVSNLLDNDDLGYAGYGVYNGGGLGANPLVQTKSGCYYLNPRMFTFSSTFSF